jgi:hypothetical protein
MDNHVVLSAARTGSSYFSLALAKQISVLEPNVFYGGEFFRWPEYFQLGPPTSVGPGSLPMLEKNPKLLDEYERSPPEGNALHFNMEEGGCVRRTARETTWKEVSPVSFRRAWEESQRRLALLENSYYPWVIKVFPTHLQCLDLYRFNRLLQRENTKVVILYRGFLWEWFLSSTSVRRTGIFAQTQPEGNWEKPEITARELPADSAKDWYGFAREFVNMAFSYRRLADYVVPYESLSGSPQGDANRITGIDLFPDVPHLMKLWTTEEKEKMISNLDEVRDTFLAYCKLLGFPDGKMFI